MLLPYTTLFRSDDVALHVRLDRPRVHADRVVEARALEDVALSKLVVADDAPRLAHADLRCDLEDVGLLESRLFAKEREEVDDLAPALELGAAELLGVRRVDCAAVGIRELRHVHAPFRRILLRTDDRRLARKFPARALRLRHPLRHLRPRPA